MSVAVLFRQLENVLNKRNNDEAVGRRQSGELGRLGSGGSKGLFDVALPLRMQKFGMPAGLDVDADDFRRET